MGRQTSLRGLGFMPTKTGSVGLTITVGMTKVTEVGQEILNTIAAYSESGNLTMFQLADPKNTLKRFRAALGQMKDGDAIVVMAEKDGLSGPIIKALNIQQVPADLPKKYSLAEDSSLVQAFIKELPDGEKRFYHVDRIKNFLTKSRKTCD